MTAGGSTRGSRLPVRHGRRRFLQGTAALGAGLVLPSRAGPVRAESADAGATHEYRLRVGAATVALHGRARLSQPAWGYNGSVPGPLLRARRGDTLRIVVDNELEQPTTVHWHGLRVPNAMDGVPHVTQPPIAPGERFVYEFAVPDAGTFWYHPHMHGEEQVGRGLYGALIVDEPDPPAVDRDILWVLDDWRLTESGDLAGGFGNLHDRSHAGRVGNHITINGLPPGPLRLRPGERVRLRLLNAANARNFALTFGGHRPWLVALDGQPHEPVRLEPGEPLVLGASMRADLVLDGDGDPDSRHTVMDTFYRDMEYELATIVYAGTAMHSTGAPEAPVLPANPLSEPDEATAERHEVTLDGGMMGDMRGLVIDGAAADTVADMDVLRRTGLMWGMNRVAAARHDVEPALTLTRGRSCILRIENRTAWHHPMHLHGHSFRVVARDGEPTSHREWRDTVMVAPRETVDIAFVADNPGDWMFHCHILGHLAGGMMSLVRVT